MSFYKSIRNLIPLLRYCFVLFVRSISFSVHNILVFMMLLFRSVSTPLTTVISTPYSIAYILYILLGEFSYSLCVFSYLFSSLIHEVTFRFGLLDTCVLLHELG